MTDLEGHEVAEKEAPHDPQGRGEAEILRPLPAPRVEPEGAEPLVDGHGHGRHVEAHEDADPQVEAEGLEEGEEGDVLLGLDRLQDGQPGIEVGDGEINHFAPAGRDAQGREAEVGRSGAEVRHDPVPLARPLGPALPVRHDVDLELDLQVARQVLHQVDGVAVAAGEVVRVPGEELAAALVVRKDPGQLVLLGGGHP